VMVRTCHSPSGWDWEACTDPIGRIGADSSVRRFLRPMEER
jgi:hypothetical protein